jgi:hypothetical protein
MDDFSMLCDGRVLDSSPMEWGDPVLVFDMATRSWVPFDGTVGQ